MSLTASARLPCLSRALICFARASRCAAAPAAWDSAAGICRQPLGTRDHSTQPAPRAGSATRRRRVSNRRARCTLLCGSSSRPTHPAPRDRGVICPTPRGRSEPPGSTQNVSPGDLRVGANRRRLAGPGAPAGGTRSNCSAGRPRSSPRTTTSRGFTSRVGFGLPISSASFTSAGSGVRRASIRIVSSPLGPSIGQPRSPSEGLRTTARLGERGRDGRVGDLQLSAPVPGVRIWSRIGSRFDRGRSAGFREVVLDHILNGHHLPLAAQPEQVDVSRLIQFRL